MTKVYVASSWRNKHYPEVVKQLKSHGFDAYDFRNPPDGKGGFFGKTLIRIGKIGQRVITSTFCVRMNGRSMASKEISMR